MLQECLWELLRGEIGAAFVANVIVRDDETGFAPIVRSTRMRKFDYLFGRFSGAFAAGCCAFAAVPLAMLIGASMSGSIQGSSRRFSLAPDLKVYALLCVPTRFVAATACFALATMTRSMLATYVGLVAYHAVPDYEDDFRPPEARAHDRTIRLLRPRRLVSRDQVLDGHRTQHTAAAVRRRRALEPLP